MVSVAIGINIPIGGYKKHAIKIEFMCIIYNLIYIINCLWIHDKDMAPIKIQTGRC